MMRLSEQVRLIELLLNKEFLTHDAKYAVISLNYQLILELLRKWYRFWDIPYQNYLWIL